MPLEDNIPLVGTCCLNHVGIKGHLTHQAALDLLWSSEAGAVASRVCTALQEESRDKRDRNSVSRHCGQWVGECLQKYVSEHTHHLQERIAERGSLCSSD